MAMRIVVLVKHVPEPTATWRFAGDHTLDRDGVEGRLSQLDEYAIEQAVKLVEAGTGAEITCLTMGPPKAADALRKALAMGAAKGVHVCDDALHGSDALATSLVLAAAVRRIGFDLVICGMASTDAEMSVVPSMLADRLGVPQATNVADLAVDGGSVTAHRDTDTATEELSVSLPAVVSVTDQSGEPRYPTFKNIMAARKKPVETWSLADLGVAPGEVGLAAAGTAVRETRPRPPRAAGTVIVDEGDAAARLADFLTAGKFI
jgi:electron transfer flavoprotein beta subunit